ncbi:Protein CBG25983 [Caenorhabditis briggsae]|uniref:Protein CBG25983 n=1 Tax=Caenorhabditis briggsae TaxID=6238 RepID=B6IKT3_CAEBR|nr:Protein CBG25983 [Caenorhabditis briggsae]CAS00513.1 Protein CBG25983 [Caenorhabditis briggsae]
MKLQLFIFRKNFSHIAYGELRLVSITIWWKTRGERLKPNMVIKLTMSNDRYDKIRQMVEDGGEAIDSEAKKVDKGLKTPQVGAILFSRYSLWDLEDGRCKSFSFHWWRVKREKRHTHNIHSFAGKETRGL